MKEYRIISGSTTDNLADKVHVHLQDGWLPHGSMINGDSEWHQPMIKYAAGLVGGPLLFDPSLQQSRELTNEIRERRNTTPEPAPRKSWKFWKN